MNRFLLLAAGAIVLMTAFILWADPTLIGRIRDLWDTPAKVAAHTVTAPEVVYGHFPRARPLIHAIAIACIAMTWAFAVDLYTDHDQFDLGARMERSLLIQTFQYWLIGCATSSAISLLGASTVIWWRKRNAAIT